MTPAAGSGAVAPQEFRCEDFTSRLNSSFRVRFGPEVSIDLRLTQVTDLMREAQSDAGMEAFSLLFTGPAEVALPQGMYPFEHDAFGPFDLFIVPVGVGPEGRAYEVVFNRC